MTAARGGGWWDHPRPLPDELERSRMTPRRARRLRADLTSEAVDAIRGREIPNGTIVCGVRVFVDGPQ